MHFFPKIVKYWLKLSNVQRISTSQACKDKLQEGQEQPFAMKGKWEAIKMACLSVKLPSLLAVLFLVLAKDSSRCQAVKLLEDILGIQDCTNVPATTHIEVCPSI